MTLPKNVVLSLSVQAKELFFIQYGKNKCWDFLIPFYNHQQNNSDALALALEAAALAHLWHQVDSSTALIEARKRYGVALRLMRNLLEISEEQRKDTTIFTVLLLDVFEKVTDPGFQQKRENASHVEGALGLVKVRGFEEFADDNKVKILIRLYHHCVAASLATGAAESEGLRLLKFHLLKCLGRGNSGIILSSILVEYSDLRKKFANGELGSEEFVEELTGLESRLHLLEINLPKVARCTTRTLLSPTERVYGMAYHQYVNRTLCQGRNLLRVTRIDLNVKLAQYYSPTAEADEGANTYASRIEALVHDVLASVPLYTDCAGSLTQSTINAACTRHQHLPRHQSDCYLLLFPLFAAGKATTNPNVKHWVLRELRYMQTHFSVRMADVVANLLEHGKDIGIWDVHSMLGCYSFNV